MEEIQQLRKDVKQRSKKFKQYPLKLYDEKNTGKAESTAMRVGSVAASVGGTDGGNATH
jgi:hypothetical protein